MDEHMKLLAEVKRIVEELLDSNRYDFEGLRLSDLEGRLPVMYDIFDKWTTPVCMLEEQRVKWFFMHM